MMIAVQKIAIPDLDRLDECVRQGEILDGHQIVRLTSIVRRLVEIITDAGGGGFITSTEDAKGGHDGHDQL